MIKIELLEFKPIRGHIKLCTICNKMLYGGIGSHFNKDKIHKQFIEREKQIALSYCGKMTPKDVKLKFNLFISSMTIAKLWRSDPTIGTKQCPVCGKWILAVGSHFRIDESHKQFIKKELDIAFKHYGIMSINEIILKFNLVISRHFIETHLANKYSKNYICQVSHKLAAIKNKGHIPWNKGLTKETNYSMSQLSQKIINMYNEGKRKSCHKGRTFEEMYGLEKAKKLKEGISKTHKGKYISEEHKKILYKYSFLNKGKTFSCEHRRNLSEAKRGKYMGEKNHQWKGGTSFEPYPPSFNDIFKEAIKDRDQLFCQLCGLSEQDSVLLCRRRLVVHHIDYNKKNTFPQNCITLCNRCNVLANKDREIWIKHFQGLLTKLYNYEYTQDNKMIINLATIDEKDWRLFK